MSCAEDFTAGAAPLPAPSGRILFGREDLTRVYDRARDYIVRHKLLRLTRYEETDGIRRLTICNLWRIERHPDQHIELFEFDLVQARWLPCHNSERWPDMPFCPIRPGLGWWREIIRLMVQQALSAAGFDTLSDDRPPLPWEMVGADEESLRERGPYFRPAANVPKVMGKKRMADILTRRYIGKAGLTDDNTKGYRGGILDTANLERGARALRAQFCEHILDGEVLSQVLAVNFQAGTMRQYLRYALHRDGLLKVGRERHNLLPLLPLVKPQYWGKDALFAEKYWVHGASGKTPLDRRFRRSVSDGGVRQLSLADRSAWRWISKAPLTVVRAWADNGCHRFLPALLAGTGFRGKAPVYAYAVLFSHWGSRRLQQSAGQLGIPGSRLLKIYLEHSAALWQTRGYPYTKGWLRGLRAWNSAICSTG